MDGFGDPGGDPAAVPGGEILAADQMRGSSPGRCGSRSEGRTVCRSEQPGAAADGFGDPAEDPATVPGADQMRQPGEQLRGKYEYHRQNGRGR